MTPLFAGLAVGLSLSMAQPALAQDASGAPASGQVKPERPAESTAPAPPKRKLLFDVIRAVVPPLIDAATKPRPAPVEPAAIPAEPAPAPLEPVVAQPIAPVATAAPPPPTIAPKPAQPPLAPRPVKASPPPPTPTVTAAPPIAPVVAPVRVAPPPPPAPTLAASAPAVAPVPRVPAPSPAPVPAERPWPLLALLALAAIGLGAAGLQWRKRRRIARTRAALALSPRLDLSAGKGGTSGFALAGPAFSLRARLDPAPAHG